ncbi:linamarin synthase 2-like [Chenopodium quinoa]|uniref:Glycosyltransferase n=1 Tax=Chenopodium quinoa TaxID=63459 RepID=A0A803KSI2_CHEQI|nr:linamarin synthase 2-like [Chenopodium quinoa]
MNNKPHAVCVAFPAQGHLIPMMQLAKLLHSRGFYITFVNTHFNHNRLIKANKGSSSSDDDEWVSCFPDFKFESMDDGLPPSDRDATQDPPTLCYALRDNCLPASRELLARVRAKTGVLPVTCVISDGLLGGVVEAAREIGVPGIQLWTASACGFLGYLYYPQLLERGIIPFKDENYKHDGTLNTPVNWIPGMENMRLGDLPSLMRITDEDEILFTFQKEQVQSCLKASALIFNTFDSFEQRVLEAIKSNISPQIYTIGPLQILEQKHVPESPLKSFRPTLWKDDIQCLEWLAQRKPKSVVYVNYGSVTTMSKENVVEFAWGLAKSKHPFLWVLRPDVVSMEESELLPKEFFDEVRDRGLVVSWCPQEQVLVHPAVGVFLTHCGWNSLLEAVCRGGLPIICWPFFFEQPTNCRYACLEDEWGVGLEVNQEVKRKEIQDLVREVMDGKKGEKLRKNALGWQERAEEATDVGGSSFDDFERLIKEALHSECID